MDDDKPGNADALPGFFEFIGIFVNSYESKARRILQGSFFVILLKNELLNLVKFRGTIELENV